MNKSNLYKLMLLAGCWSLTLPASATLTDSHLDEFYISLQRVLEEFDFSTAELFNGTNQDDLIAGNTGFNAIINGYGGSDVLSGSPAVSGTFGFPYPFTITLLNSIISGGTGNDFIGGDADAFTGVFIGGTDVYVNSGNDFLIGGSGNDVISADISSLSLTELIVPDMSSPNPEDWDIAWLNINLDNVLQRGDWGDDTVLGGDGNDKIFGTALNHYHTYRDSPSVVVEHNQGTVPGSVALDQDFIDGGNGDDLIAGNDCYMIMATYNTALDFQFRSKLEEGDVLLGGNGNDTVIGDQKRMIMRFVDSIIGDEYLDASQTQSTNPASDRARLEAGTADVNEEGYAVYQMNDLIHGDNGNDELYGDLLDVNMNIQTSSGLMHNYQGNDKIYGDNGDDKLVGDIGSMVHIQDSSSSLKTNVYLGDDHLIGGIGNDHLVGDIVSMDMSGHQNQSLANMTFGADTFYFDLDNGFGNDVIDDLNAGGVVDKLAFKLDEDSNLDNLVNITENGEGKVVLDFGNSGKITTNLTYTGQSSIYDLGVDIDVNTAWDAL